MAHKEKFSICAEPALKARIDRIAAISGRSLSSTAALLIEMALEQLRKESRERI